MPAQATSGGLASGRSKEASRKRMRSEAEIREAIRYHDEARTSIPDGAVIRTAAALQKGIDILHWVLGEPSEFEAAMDLIKALSSPDQKVWLEHIEGGDENAR